MRWAALLYCMMLCLGCPRATPTSLEETPDAFLHIVQARMQAGLDVMYFSAMVEQISRSLHALISCTHR
jgi:hypothetical protein